MFDYFFEQYILVKSHSAIIVHLKNLFFNTMCFQDNSKYIQYIQVQTYFVRKFGAFILKLKLKYFETFQ